LAYFTSYGSGSIRGRGAWRRKFLLPRTVRQQPGREALSFGDSLYLEGNTVYGMLHPFEAMRYFAGYFLNGSATVDPARKGSRNGKEHKGS